jgi:hypothetical protein
MIIKLNGVMQSMPKQYNYGQVQLAAYIADYINEELARGNTDIDKYMIADAIDAYEGGAE